MAARLRKSESSPRLIHFGREVCGDLDASEKREWLVTNGIGGFASGTVAGTLARRYHGMLIAALNPPVGRTLLVAKLDETVEYDGREYPLAANRWGGGAVDPQGYRLLESFRLEGSVPVWTYAFGDALLEKRVWMQQGSNTTYVRYDLVRGGRAAQIACKALVNYRDYHSTTHAGDWRMDVQPVENGLRVRAYDGAAPIYLLSSTAAGEAAHNWHHNYDLITARYRGLDDREDHLHAATFRATLQAGDSVTIVCTTEAGAQLDGDAALGRQREHEAAVLTSYGAESESPAWIRQLVLAADQFIAQRPLADDADALTVIAGYHWFSDWGRDTMIALPGLTLSTGRPAVAAKILRTFARFVDRGMLPNVFPDAGATPEYNTVDATLWFFEAVRLYDEAHGARDPQLLRDLYPVLAEVVDWHLRGTRYGISVDPTDGLLRAGEPGVQLTWMDAKVDGIVVTPRIGKPVEVNALWHNALVTMAQFARKLKKNGTDYQFLARRARDNFQRFWYEKGGYCYDVIDAPEGNDATLRPNQIFAVSLPHSPLSEEQQAAVVDVCARRLLTSAGLRSLAADHPDFRGHYGGTPHDRDFAYHQGTVWAWLLGPFVQAHLRVHKDAELAASFLAPVADHLKIHGLGSVSEIFDGDAPFTPRGCIAQAWSVAEVLRAWQLICAVRTPQEAQRAVVGGNTGMA